MGAIDPLRWHSWHFACKMGAMSLANVTGLPAGAALVRSAAVAGPASVRETLSASTLIPRWRHTERLACVMIGSFALVLPSSIQSAQVYLSPKPVSKEGGVV